VDQNYNKINNIFKIQGEDVQCETPSREEFMRHFNVNTLGPVMVTAVNFLLENIKKN
jgi:preprotein translocase subunit Sss1